MDTNRDSAHQSQNEDNFPTFFLGQLLRFFRALQTSHVLHNSIVHAKAWTNC